MDGTDMKFARFLIYPIIAVNVFSVIGLLITGYSYILSPLKWPILSMMGYIFPFFLFLTGLFIAFWVFIKFRYILISVVGLILAYQPVTLYCPLNAYSDSEKYKSEDSEYIPLTVVTYNTCNWGSVDKSDFKKENAESVIEYIASQKPDIVCMQESPFSDKVNDIIKEYLPEMNYRSFFKSTNDSNVTVTFLSKYPIKREERIDIPSKGNGSGAIWVDINGKALMVVNCHLETQSLSVKERAKFSRLVHDVAKGDAEKDSVESGSTYFLGKLSASAKKRAPQAEKIADVIEKNSDTPIIVCGDFNDIPLSYTHYAISKNLTDCFQKKGRGFGFSYCRNAMRVRIDHIMCSSDIEPLMCKVDSEMKSSDHFPVVCNILLPK
jgi:endonuclease/exonuclease/phosphatase family metal-dependent hydrolase